VMILSSSFMGGSFRRARVEGVSPTWCDADFGSR
jgi:hypothetical protein